MKFTLGSSTDLVKGESLLPSVGALNRERSSRNAEALQDLLKNFACTPKASAAGVGSPSPHRKLVLSIVVVLAVSIVEPLAVSIVEPLVVSFAGPLVVSFAEALALSEAEALAVSIVEALVSQPCGVWGKKKPQESRHQPLAADHASCKLCFFSPPKFFPPLAEPSGSHDP